ncbi:MAG: hypothetical protein U0414_09930 [Polyangiaceae bacterium]
MPFDSMSAESASQRAVPSRRSILVPRAALVIGIAALAACGNKKPTGDGTTSSRGSSAPPAKTFLTWKDFAAVCTEGKGVEGAAKYEKQPGKESPVAYMYRDTAGLGDKAVFDHKYDSSFKTWEAKDEKASQLVACVDVQKAEKDHDCEFEKGGKSERWRSTIKITIHEATTGKKLGEETVDVKVPGCPMFAFLEKDKVTKDYGSYSAYVLGALAEHEAADAPQPSLHAETFSSACDGKRAVGAGKPSTEKGKYNPFVTFLREKDGPWIHGEVNHYYFGEHAWFDPNLNAQSNDKEPRTSIAVCMTSTRGAKADDCEFSGGSKLTIFKGDWKVDVVDASTGKVLKTKNFAGKPECPTIWSFDRGKEWTAEPGDELREWLRPIVDPK